MFNPITSAYNALEHIRIAKLEKKFGKQIGKIAPNGNMTFQKKVNGTQVTTGVRYNGKPIAQVTNNGDIIRGMGKKVRYNDDGDIVEVAHIRRATNYRKNVRENLDTGEVNSRTLHVNQKNEYVVDHTVIDKHGAVVSETTPVKIKGESSPVRK